MEVTEAMLRWRAALEVCLCMSVCMLVKLLEEAFLAAKSVSLPPLQTHCFPKLLKSVTREVWVLFLHRMLINFLLVWTESDPLNKLYLDRFLSAVRFLFHHWILAAWHMFWFKQPPNLVSYIFLELELGGFFCLLHVSGHTKQNTLH